MARERSVSDVCLSPLVVSLRGIKHCLCISCEVCTVPSLYRPSTDGLTYMNQEYIKKAAEISNWQSNQVKVYKKNISPK